MTYSSPALERSRGTLLAGRRLWLNVVRNVLAFFVIFLLAGFAVTAVMAVLGIRGNQAVVTFFVALALMYGSQQLQEWRAARAQGTESLRPRNF
jgi:hypothetical protein